MINAFIKMKKEAKKRKEQGEKPVEILNQIVDIFNLEPYCSEVEFIWDYIIFELF